MDEKKQIEEITKILDSNCEGIPDTVCQENSCSSCKAKQIIGVGYRKQSVVEWISVEERLPDIEPYGKGRYGGRRSVRVLCACKQRDGRTFVKEGYCEPCGSGKIVWRIPGSIDSVTHWMPLPEPPKGD